MAGGSSTPRRYFWNEPAVRTEIVRGRADGAGVKLGRGCAVLHYAGTVLAEGIGEELSVLPAMPKYVRY